MKIECSGEKIHEVVKCHKCKRVLPPNSEKHILITGWMKKKRNICCKLCFLEETGQLSGVKKSNSDKVLLVGFLVVIGIVAIWAGSSDLKSIDDKQSNQPKRNYLDYDGNPITKKEAFKLKSKCFQCGKDPADPKYTTQKCYLCSEKCKREFLRNSK